MGKGKSDGDGDLRAGRASRPLQGSAVGSVRDAWDRLERWCQGHLPGLLQALNPGASLDEIAALERAIRRSLPKEVRESLLIHNGQRRDQLTGFVFNLDLLDTGSIVEEWGVWSGLKGYNEEYRDGMASLPAGAIELDYANPGWIPLAKGVGAGYVAVDLAPGPAGAVGQVINFGRDENLKCVLSAGWDEFLHSYAAFLESGALKEIHPEAKFWGDNFEPVFEAVRDGQSYVRRPLDALVEWRKEGRWPIR